MKVDKTKLNPNQLVRVKKDGYSFIGETISRPTPENTIMVRRVPGDSLTMEEINIDTLEVVYEPKSYKWIHYAIVSGRFSFPVDMLRYDDCAPVNFTIDEDGDPHLTDENPSCNSKLVIARIDRLKKPSWTIARWNSFSWEIEYLGQPIKYERR